MQQTHFTSNHRARVLTWAFVSLLVALCVWALFSWPLPAKFCKGIPHTAIAPANQRVAHMAPGDHLQLLYHFWLAGDMIRGGTPPFHNLYEFNIGNDYATRRVGPYYFPFSFLYWLGECLGGRAVGWNVTGILALWASYVLTCLLARRYTASDVSAFVAALPGVSMPLYWVSLLGGSPFGFALMWCPAMLLGLDLAIRDLRAIGGLMAGLALLFASWTDSHVFFFCTLMAPAWSVIVFLQRERFAPWGRTLRGLVVPLLPAATLAVAALLINHFFMMSKSAADVLAGGGRRLQEAQIFSPDWHGLFRPFADGTSTQIYIGWSIIVCVTAAAISSLIPASRRKGAWAGERRVATITMVLVLAALGAVVMLALGPRGPEHGLAFRAVRKLIPPYTMIRQPAKIFCLVPSLLAIVSALAFNRLGPIVPRRLATGILPLWALLLLAEYRHPIRAGVCLLDDDQAAYAAVAADAGACGVAARALVVPLWPGDSHWSSLYDYYASQRRIRMVNGYQPFVSRGYMTNVFQRLESVNKGFLDDAQLTWLSVAGVTHVILHEDAFPEKVSPFPAGDTLRRLLQHPRLRLLTQADGVWAFRIETQPVSPASSRPTPALPYLFPTRFWEVERIPAGERGVIEASDASSGRAVRMTPTSGRLVSGSVTAVRDERLLWLIRLRGNGTLRLGTMEDGTNRAGRALTVSGADWQWATAPVEQQRAYAALAASLAVGSGCIDVDLVILAGGPWKPLGAGENVVLPAASFFHAGYTDPQTMHVVLRPLRDAADVVFYGWRLPLEPGRYRVDFACASDGPAGAVLGTIVCDDRLGQTAVATVTAGSPASGILMRTNNLPPRIGFRYAGRAKVEITELELTRLE